MGIIAAVGGLVLLVALGGVFALSAATDSGATPSTQPAAVASGECHGKTDCANEYSVALSCGGSAEARTVNVVARDAEAAERKAERYNRDCRSRSVLFVTSFTRSAASSAVRAVHAEEPPRKVAADNDSRSRTRVRFRRR